MTYFTIILFFLRPLQKMGVGMALTALSFVIAGFLQLNMEVNCLALVHQKQKI